MPLTELVLKTPFERGHWKGNIELRERLVGGVHPKIIYYVHTRIKHGAYLYLDEIEYRGTEPDIALQAFTEAGGTIPADFVLRTQPLMSPPGGAYL